MERPLTFPSATRRTAASQIDLKLSGVERSISLTYLGVKRFEEWRLNKIPIWPTKRGDSHFRSDFHQASEVTVTSKVTVTWLRAKWEPYLILVPYRS